MNPNFRLLKKQHKRPLDTLYKYYSKKEEFPKSNAEVIKRHNQNVAQNYAPHPIAIVKGKGMYLFDVEGKKYIDCLAGFAAASAGHGHPKIIGPIQKQLNCLTHSSRSVYIANLANYGQYICKLFNYEKMLPMNTGVEACETAIKCARKWGYEIKKIPTNEAILLLAHGNFFGRTIAATSGSSNEFYKENFGPFLPGLKLIPYNDICAIEQETCNPKVCGLMIEPLQGEGGIRVPDEGYLRKVREICTRDKVLWIADEIQSGIGRTGRLLCCDHECVRPDIVTLGKGLTGGTFPASAVLASAKILDLIKPGQHGSTYGGNPVACVAAVSALEVLLEENLIENSEKIGNRILCKLKDLPSSAVKEVRGRGLMIGIEFCKDIKVDDVSKEILKLGMITKSASGNVLRITPPLIITADIADEACEIIKKAIDNMTKKC